ncbi:MAG: glycosyltransferase [Dissulfurispiraceae bacterium]
MADQKRIRLLYFHPTIVFGGAERTTALILENLDKTIFDVVFVTKKKVFPSLSVGKTVYIDDLGVNDGFAGFSTLVKDARTIGRLIKDEADLAFGMLHYGCIVLAALKFFLRSKVRIIVSPRTPSKDGIKFHLKDKAFARILWNLMVRFFCRYSDGIIVASEGLREECIVKYQAERKKIATVHNSVDVESIEKLSAEAFDCVDGRGTYVISTAGRLAAEKNIDVLFKAFAMLRKDMKAKLWVIGEGPERLHLESLAASLSIDNDVVFLGFQENPYKFIKKSDAFVHTSLFEGFGNVILEAMACGVPVVATDCPFGPREMIDNMKNGILVPMSDDNALAEALRIVLQSDELRRNLVASAFEGLENFSAAKMVTGYEHFFLEIAKVDSARKGWFR